MQLDTHEAVHKMIDEFDPGGSDEISEYFTRHGVEPTGVIHYGVVMARAALASHQLTETMFITLFCGGVALGLHLGDGAPNPQRVADLLETERLTAGRDTTLVGAVELETLLLIVYDLEPLETKGRKMYERRYALHGPATDRHYVASSGILSTRWEPGVID